MSQVRPMIKALTAHVQSLTVEVSQELSKVNRQQDATNEVIAALIEVVGQEKVQEAIKAARAARQKSYEDAQDAATLKMVEAGALAAVEEVGAESLVVGVDTLADGSTRKVRFEMKALSAEQKGPFLGKKLGEKVVNEGNKTSCEVVAIYSINEAKVEEMMNPKPTSDEALTPEGALPAFDEGAVVVKKKGKKARKARA